MAKCLSSLSSKIQTSLDEDLGSLGDKKVQEIYSLRESTPYINCIAGSNSDCELAIKSLKKIEDGPSLIDTLALGSYINAQTRLMKTMVSNSSYHFANKINILLLEAGIGIFEKGSAIRDVLLGQTIQCPPVKLLEVSYTCFESAGVSFYKDISLYNELISLLEETKMQVDILLEVVNDEIKSN